MTPARRVRPAGPLLLAWLTTLGVLLMHAAAPGGGCPGGMSMASAPSHQSTLGVAAPPAPAVLTTAPAGRPAAPLTMASAAGGTGQLCVSLPAPPWLAGVLTLLLAAAAYRRRPLHPAALRRSLPVRRPPPLPAPDLLTRICVSRT